jgi:hypothetical protein
MQALGDQEFLAQLKQIGDSLGTIVDVADASQGKEWKTIATDLRGSTRVSDILQSSLNEVLRSEKAEAVIGSVDVMRVRERIAGARRLLWRISARRFPKLVYRLRAGLQHSGGEGDETLAREYCQAEDRYKLEREIEKACHLPSGSIVVHCPRRKTSMKVAEVLVVGADQTRVARLRDVTSVSPESLEPYQEEIRAIENMYRSIWQFHVYLDYAWFDKQPVVEWVLQDRLGFPNDKLFVQELATEEASVYSLLAKDFRGEIPPNRLSQVIQRVDRDQEVVKLRHGGGKSGLRARVLALIREVTAKAATDGETGQIELPGLQD